MIDKLNDSRKVEALMTGAAAASLLLASIFTFEMANGEETCVQPSLDTPVNLADCAASVGINIDTINAK